MRKFLLNIMMVLNATTFLFAQSTISGVVKDDAGEELPGATVIVKGTSNGTTTNVNGNFRLNDVAENDILVISFVGFIVKEVEVGTRTSFDITLQADITTLNEVVVVGYGTQLKRDLTGSVGQVKSEDLAKAPTSNFDQALGGRIAGVQVSATDGTPGASLNIVIRGGNSLTNTNSPLFVIDGVPLEGFDPASLNTNDIESFDVLKDASATAIYGSRGANGVIVINTKGGRTDGTTEVTFIARAGAQYIPSRLEVLGPYEYVRYLEERALILDNYVPGIQTSEFYNTWGDPELYRDVEGTSWQDEIFRTATFQDYNVSVSGGSGGTSLFYSGQYLDQEGTIINTNFSKFLNNLRIEHEINEKVQLATNLVYNLSKREGVNVNGNQFGGVVIRDVIRFRPVEPINGDGGFGIDPDDLAQTRLFNPVDNLNNTDRLNRTELFRGIVTLDYSIFKGLNLRLSGSYQSSSREVSTFFGEETFQGSRGNDLISGSIDNARTQILTTSNTLEYKTNFSGDQRFSVLGGIEFQESSTNSYDLSSNQIPTDVFGINNLGLGTVPGVPGSSATRNVLLSYFSRATYALKDKYLATVNFRVDQSSKFRPGNRTGYFPSFSLAWRIVEEPFLAGSQTISDLKLRAGWGVTGNNRIPDFAAFTTLNPGVGTVLGNDESFAPGAVVNNLGVPDLTWESTAQFNIGLDYGLFGDRIQGEIDVFRKRTTDLLLNADVALSTGFERVQQNVGEIENKGLEITVRSQNVQAGDFKWSTDFNISFIRSKVIALNQGQSELLTDPNFLAFGEQNYISRVGGAVGLMYGYEFDRLYQFEDFIDDTQSGGLVLKDGVPGFPSSAVAPGGVLYVDQNGDGVITELDRVVIGDPTPDFIGGMTNNFEYKNFDLQIFLQFSKGADILNANRAEFSSTNPSALSGFSDLANRWTPTNTDTEIHGLRFGTPFGRPPAGFRINDQHVEDGSFLRVRTVSLGYTVPNTLLSKIGFKSVRFSLSAQNLFTFTNYSGYDPEVSITRGGIPRALIPNLDFSAYPQSVTVTGGIRASF